MAGPFNSLFGWSFHRRSVSLVGGAYAIDGRDSVRPMVDFPHSSIGAPMRAGRFLSSRHFILTFHDSVFECVAESFSVERSIYARNATIHPTLEAAKQSNDFMEALHAIPDFLIHWSLHDSAELRLHLATYPAARWPGTPVLVHVFDRKLAARSK